MVKNEDAKAAERNGKSLKFQEAERNSTGNKKKNISVGW